MAETKFEYRGKQYKAVPSAGCDGCDGCAFYDDAVGCGDTPGCSASNRKDDRDIVFVLDDAETFELDGKRYRTEDAIRGGRCEGCAFEATQFQPGGCIESPDCGTGARADGRDVIFVWDSLSSLEANESQVVHEGVTYTAVPSAGCEGCAGVRGNKPGVCHTGIPCSAKYRTDGKDVIFVEEKPIDGTPFTYNGKTYRAVKYKSCGSCPFIDEDCSDSSEYIRRSGRPTCWMDHRADGRSVQFGAVRGGHSRRGSRRY